MATAEDVTLEEAEVWPSKPADNITPRRVTIGKPPKPPFTPEAAFCPQDHNPTDPTHYSSLPSQPLDFIMANGLDFCEGNIVKYVSRWRVKGGLTDLKKARVYLNRLIEQAEKAEGPSWY